MSDDRNAKMFDKIKKIKFDILKRCKQVEDKHGSEKTTSFMMHETKSVLKNIAFWKIPEFGVITVDDVKTAIYQLERDGFIEIINRDQIKLTQKGSNIAQELRAMRFEEVPDTLLSAPPNSSAHPYETMRCLHCGKAIEIDSIYCKYCGTKVNQLEEFCTYCGASITPGSQFCSICGKKI
ncbi:MAG: zinc ribbon domain-containing protein [Candidatus Helarchaeota archaeon]